MSNASNLFEHMERGDVEYFQTLKLDVMKKFVDECGNSLLTVAVRFNKLNCLQVICRRCPQLLCRRDDDEMTALHQAAYDGKNDMIKFLLNARATLEQGVDHMLLMMTGISHETVLYMAVKNGHFHSAKLLIEADPSNTMLRTVTSKLKQTSLHVAVRKHYLEIVELLLQADPDFEYSPNIDSKTPLFMAWQEALSGDQKIATIKKLLIRKQPSQCRLPICEKRWTLIHYATYEGDVSTIKEIIHFWPNCCHLVDKEGQNFLHLAVKFEQVDIVKYILELRNIAHSVLNEEDNYGNTPLHLATASANHTIALTLLDDSRVSKMVENKEGKKALDMVSSVFMGELIKGMYPIQWARKGDVDFFRAIHTDILRESIDEDGESVLSIAARNGHLNCCEVISTKCPELLYQTNKNKITILHEAAYNGKDDIIKFLLRPQHKMDQQGVENVKIGRVEENIDNKLLMMLSDKQCSALHFAVERGHFLSTKLLIEANLNNKLLRNTDNRKETAMHYAVKKHNLEIVKFLVEAEPDFDYSTNDSGHTPLFMAWQEALSEDPITVEIRKFLIQKQPTQCKVRVNGWTILQHATSKGDLSAVEEIIQFCPDCLELVDNENRNFLHLATKFDHEKLVKLILGVPSLSDNILNGQDINGDTPLHIATSKGQKSLAKSLLYHPRVSKRVRNKQGKFALDAPINFNYDPRRAKVTGPFDLVEEKELKDRSDFDLLVSAFIAAVSFGAGLTVPGGFICEGPNRGNAILHKKRTFKAFVIFNAIALTLSSYVLLSHFCMKRLVNKKDIIYQLKLATFSSISAIFAMMIAFIMGTFAVLSISLGLAVTVCGICCCFFVFSFYSLWRMRSQKIREHQV